MSQHPSSFQIDQKLSPELAKKLVPSLSPATEAIDRPAKKVERSGPAAALAGAALALLAGAAWYGWDYWTVERFEVSTENAYVKADKTTISPKFPATSARRWSAITSM